MDPPSERKRQRIRKIEQLCRQEGLSLTVQRRKVFETLLDGRGHPTADEVFDDVRERIPGVSRTTVYRVLNMLVRLGVVNKIYQPGGPALFDTSTHRHHHLVCLSCERVIDLENELPGTSLLPNVQRHGFEISECHVFFRGMCRECLGTQVTPRAGVGRAVKSTRSKSPKRKARTHSAKQSRDKRSR